MKTERDQALEEAYKQYLAGCEKRNAAVVWNYQEWLDGSIIAGAINHKYWTAEDNK